MNARRFFFEFTNSFGVRDRNPGEKFDFESESGGSFFLALSTQQQIE